MKTNKNNILCTVVGHNYKRVKNSNELKCANCGATVSLDKYGNFEEEPIENKDIQSTLRQLLHLNLKAKKLQLSS